jgi:uncharacterized protein YndB with AHSA1/START domain
MNDPNENIIPPDLVYITFIRSTPQKVWDALTQSAFTTQFFFGRTIEGGFALAADHGRRPRRR